MNPIVIIPSRLASSRLPDKALADIAGEPMIVHVWRRGVEADIGPVVVACGDRPIADAIEAAGGRALMTEPALPSGSDRVFAALQEADPDGRHDVVVNLQGDLPAIEPAAVAASLLPLADPAVDIGTLVAETFDPAEGTDPGVTKAALSIQPGARIGRAMWFSHAPISWGDGPLYHHIGLYAYRRPALERYVTLTPSPLELRERLEQLRALEDGMRIDAALVDSVPLGVDTPADLEQIRAMMAGNP